MPSFVVKVSHCTFKQSGPAFKPKLLSFCLLGWPCVGILSFTLHSLKAMLSLTLSQMRIKGFTYSTRSSFSCSMMLMLLNAIDIQWNRPMQISQLTACGGSPQEFNILFSFWTKWTRDAHPQATPISSWMQAFTIFLSVGGFKAAPFINNCAFIGMAIYEFRILSRNLLKMCATSENQFDDFFLIVPKWNLTDTIARLLRLQAAVSIQFEVNQQCARVPPADFVDAITKTNFMLQSDDVSAGWHLPTFTRKRVPPTWVRQVIDVRRNPQAPPNGVTCITQITLESWANMSKEDIRSLISRPGKRFIAAFKRSRLLLQHMERFVELASLADCSLPRLIPPSWNSTHSCFCCDETVPVGAQPWVLQVTCKEAALPAADVLD